MTETGRFITFEGGEGGGKSTQARLLGDFLRNLGLPIQLTREPGGTPGAEAIRRLLVDGDVDRWDATAEALLHFAARRHHLVEGILPALKRGEWVICDRFADSTMAYQGYGLGLGREPIERLYAFAVGNFAPALTLILDLPVEAGLSRAGGRGGGEDRYERMGIPFHRRLREGFLDIARREPERCVVIDATGDVETVHAHVLGAVRARFGLP